MAEQVRSALWGIDIDRAAPRSDAELAEAAGVTPEALREILHGLEEMGVLTSRVFLACHHCGALLEDDLEAVPPTIQCPVCGTRQAAEDLIPKRAYSSADPPGD